MSPRQTFILFGSGPGIGLALAKAFATTPHFSRIVLCARNTSRLQDEKAAVEAAAKGVGRDDVEVLTFALDLSDLQALPGKVRELEGMLGFGSSGSEGAGEGRLGCVWHNAAMVRHSEVLTTAVEEVEEDMKVRLTFLPCPILPLLHIK